jgi:uncharacterized protein (DUF4415 family)
MKHATTGKTTPANKAAPPEDADNPRTTLADWEGAVMKVGGQVIGHTPRRRGPGKKPTRTPIQLRLPQDALARWKATGPGWQTRMADVLVEALPTA